MDDDAKIRGTVHLIGEEKTFGTRGFRKRVLVLEQPDGRFSNYLPIDLVQEGCELADQVKVGQEVLATVRLKGRKWEPRDGGEVKYFLSAEAVSLKVVGQGAPGASAGGDDEEPPLPNDDEIPF